jgi:acetolactate synthase I/II/III large subunit
VRSALPFPPPSSANIGTVWDVHIDDLIPSRAYRRVHYSEA